MRVCNLVYYSCDASKLYLERLCYSHRFWHIYATIISVDKLNSTRIHGVGRILVRYGNLYGSLIDIGEKWFLDTIFHCFLYYLLIRPFKHHGRYHSSLKQDYFHLSRFPPTGFLLQKLPRLMKHPNFGSKKSPQRTSDNNTDKTKEK